MITKVLYICRIGVLTSSLDDTKFYLNKMNTSYYIYIILGITNCRDVIICRNVHNTK